jgi:hypothetical protein
MKHTLLCTALLLLLLPLSGLAQRGYSNRLQASDTLPWTHSLTAGFSVWPLTKERLRLGYSWEHRHQQYWLLELAYVNAVEAILFPDERYGTLEGGQLKAEYRFYEPSGRTAYFYYAPQLAYMYTRHAFKSNMGQECDVFGNCAYFRRIDEAVPAHTGTLAFSLGWIVPATPTFHFNFFGGFGLQATYFSDRKTDVYFGKVNHFSMIDGEQFVLEPRFRLGANLHFALRRRNTQM